MTEAPYYRARYYSPQIGRFMSEDPIGFGGGINFYAYLRNNPINLIDPLGLCSAKNTLMSKLKGMIPIICSGGTFDFLGASVGTDIRKAELESGVFIYQQADYSSKGLRYSSGTLREAGAVSPGGFNGGYGQIETAQGTERLVFGGRSVGKGNFQVGAGGFVGWEDGQLSLGVYGEGSASVAAGGAGYYLSFSTLGKGCQE